LADYFGHRLNLPPGDITSVTVLRALTRAGIESAQIEELRTLFDRLEARRYGLPATENIENLKSLQSSLEKILKSCEKVRF